MLFCVAQFVKGQPCSFIFCVCVKRLQHHLRYGSENETRNVFLKRYSLLKNFEFCFREVMILVYYTKTFSFFSCQIYFKTFLGIPASSRRCVFCLGRRNTSVNVASSAGNKYHEFLFYINLVVNKSKRCETAN